MRQRCKHQSANSKLQRNFNNLILKILMVVRQSLDIGAWGFFWKLEFGSWSFHPLDCFCA